MLDIMGGALLTYIYVMPLLYALVGPKTPREQRATIFFVLLWPAEVALLAVDIIIGGDDDNGTGPS